MIILLLGPYRTEMVEFLTSFGDEVYYTQEPLTTESEYFDKIDFIISYGYRHILTKEILDRFHNKAINLHISLLPWNKGADPNLWSILEDTPKGVTIHYLNHGVDTGDILVQGEVDYLPEDTLRTSYDRLTETIEDLFKQSWSIIRENQINAFPQAGEGTYHRIKDKEQYKHLISKGWDTPVLDLIGKAIKKST